MPLVAFDLDDTLYPESAFVRSGFRVVSDYLERRGIVRRPLEPDFQAAFEAGVRGRIFDRVLEAAGVPPTPDLIRTLVDVYRSHRLPAPSAAEGSAAEGPAQDGRGPDGLVRPAIRLFDDADRALAHLRREGLRLGLISDGPLEAQRLKVETLGLPDRLDAIVLTDQWGKDCWKPHPRAFQELARRLAVDPASCLYVADNPQKDFDGPAAAGWSPSVWIRRPDGLYRDAPLADARLVAATISSLDDLGEAIAGLSRGRRI